MLAMTTIGAASAERRQSSTGWRNVAISSVTLAVGLLTRPESPVALIVIIAVSTALQLILTLAGSPATRFQVVQTAGAHSLASE
jgi:hypothetical protein